MVGCFAFMDASVADVLLPEHTQEAPLAAHVEHKRRRSTMVVDHATVHQCLQLLDTIPMLVVAAAPPLM